jgi:hypothetical protein
MLKDTSQLLYLGVPAGRSPTGRAGDAGAAALVSGRAGKAVITHPVITHLVITHLVTGRIWACRPASVAHWRLGRSRTLAHSRAWPQAVAGQVAGRLQDAEWFVRRAAARALAATGSETQQVI